MPMQINDLWRVSWVGQTLYGVKVLFNLESNESTQYLLGNVLRKHGEPNIGETYRIIIMPAFPHEVIDS